MKKLTALLAAFALVFGLCACGTVEGNTPDTQPPAESAAPVASQPPAVHSPAPAETAVPAAPVVLSVSMQAEDYPAPDESDQTILSFGYDEVKVYMESNPAAAEKINHLLSVENEFFYSGSGNGDGLNVLLEQATDQFTYAHETGRSFTGFSCMRNVYVERGDSRILTLRYRVNSFTGGAHSLYFDRAYVFDVESGELLTLEELSTDKKALEEKLLVLMNEKISGDVRYRQIPEYIEKFSDTSLEDALHALLREGSWYLDETGLTVFSDLYEIGSFADGIIRFHLGYEELEGLIHEQWLPEERSKMGSVGIEALHEGADTGRQLLDMIAVDADGSDYCLYVDGTVYDLTVLSVRYFSDGVGFYPVETHWYASELSNGALQIKTIIPEGMPSLMIRYLDGAGEEHSYLIAENGRDGGPQLLEEQITEAVG